MSEVGLAAVIIFIVLLVVILLGILAASLSKSYAELEKLCNDMAEYRTKLAKDTNDKVRDRYRELEIRLDTIRDMQKANQLLNITVQGKLGDPVKNIEDYANIYGYTILGIRKI